MTYQVLARKWRPQSLDEVVGQKGVVQSLRNALLRGRLPHALLFTGPRGTGKTSSARILAKMLRCTQVSDQYDPCHTCSDCVDISLGRSVDVLEIDGASNNGVDSIRELRNTVAFAPSSGKYKLYIVDEVHMLSTSAFNALLKTLEEPPEHVIFILATTEVHKVPITILSRCQRFDFRKISTRMIADHLEKICREESIEADPESLWMIAKLAGGSMRDSQSLLDQVINFCNGKLEKKTVAEVLGLSSQGLIQDFVSAVLARDTLKGFAAVEAFQNGGQDPELFLNQFLEWVRHLIVVKNGVENLDLSSSDVEWLKTLAPTVQSSQLQVLFDMALKGLKDLFKSPDPSLILDVVALRLLQHTQVTELHQVLDLLQRPENMLSRSTDASFSGASAPLASTSAGSATSATNRSPSFGAHKSHASSSPSAVRTSSALSTGSPSVDPNLSPMEQWIQFVRDLKRKDAFLAAKVEPLQFIKKEGVILIFAIPKSMTFLKDQLLQGDTQQKLVKHLASFWGTELQMQFIGDGKVEGFSVQDLTQQDQGQKAQALKEQVLSHPKLQSLTKNFNLQIKDIQPLGDKKRSTQ